MGVRGLSWFVYSEGGSLLEPYKLCQTTVVIDANNFLHIFFDRLTESRELVFGGDYDYLYSRVINFFGLMLRCGINPILLFDGCQPETKFETTDLRRRVKLESLIKLSRGVKSDPLYPLFMYESFREGLEKMGIRYCQVYEEADPQVAALAEHLGCPVLSDDSDFFIYDVDVIPLRMMDFACTEDEDGSLYFPCQLYRSGNMSRLFPGLQRPILPMVDIIVGNSFVGKSFTHVFTRSDSRNFRDIFEVLRTVNNRETVITRILQSLDSKDVEGVERAIREVLATYDVPPPVSLYMADVGTRTTRDAAPSIYGLVLSGLPDEFFNFYESGQVSALTLNLLRYRRHHLPIAIEDINENSCHFSSVPIIREIYKILRTVMRLPEEITLNIRVRKSLVNTREICSNQDYTRAAPLRRDVLKEGEDLRRKVFFQSLGLDEMDGERLGGFDDDWILFVMSVVYWLRDQRKLRQSHLWAVLLMALCIYVKSMGDPGEGQRREKCDPARPFTHLLKRIPNSEHKKFHDRFNKVRRSDCDILARGDYFPAIHVFACLQSILCHVVELNNILGGLFRGFQVRRFYSGTLLFNLFVLSEDGAFTKEVVEDLPQMRGTYEFLESSVVFFGGRPAKK